MDNVAGRKGSQIEAAKRKAVGGKRKRCTKGKSCSATCIAANKICLVEIPWVSASSMSKAVKLIENRSATKSAIKVEKPGSNGIRFEGDKLIVGNETFTPGKKLPGSTQPTLYVDKEGKGKWVVKEGGAAGQNTAENTTNKVYNLLEPKLGTKGVDSTLVDGKAVNKFVEGGRTLDSLSQAEMRRFNVADKIKRSHLADALVANWDYVGLVNDNIMVDKQGRLVRIDSGGTFQYRAQGGAKNFTPVPMEVWSLRSGQGAQFWSNASNDDYRNLWVNQTKAIASEAPRLKSIVASSGLPDNVKTAFNRRVDALSLVNSTLGSYNLPANTVSWKAVDSALERAFKASNSLDPNSPSWNKDFQSELRKQLDKVFG